MSLLYRLAICGAALGLGFSTATAQSPIVDASGARQNADQQIPAEATTDAGSSDQENGAARVIPAHQADGAIVFVHRPVVQPIPSIEPDVYAYPVEKPERYAVDSDSVPAWPAPDGQDSRYGEAGSGGSFVGELANQRPVGEILYAYPAVYSQYPVQGQEKSASGNYSVIAGGEPPNVPPGGRLVQFDRDAWLTECDRRLSLPHDEDDEDSPTARSPRGSWSECERYLDRYMASARSGALHGQYSDSGQYMLVPVTVMVPRRAVYRTVAPDEQ